MNTTVGLSVRGVIGALVGGTVGFIVFVWLARQGLYALVLPGAMLGLGCAVAMRKSSSLAGILCCLAAVPLGLICEWEIRPFRDDPGLAYFLTHLHQLDARNITLIMIAMGAAFAFWLGKGRDDYHVQRTAPSADK